MNSKSTLILFCLLSLLGRVFTEEKSHFRKAQTNSNPQPTRGWSDISSSQFGFSDNSNSDFGSLDFNTDASWLPSSEDSTHSSFSDSQTDAKPIENNGNWSQNNSDHTENENNSSSDRGDNQIVSSDSQSPPSVTNSSSESIPSSESSSSSPPPPGSPDDFTSTQPNSDCSFIGCSTCSLDHRTCQTCKKDFLLVHPKKDSCIQSALELEQLGEMSSEFLVSFISTNSSGVLPKLIATTTLSENSKAFSIKILHQEVLESSPELLNIEWKLSVKPNEKGQQFFPKLLIVLPNQNYIVFENKEPFSIEFQGSDSSDEEAENEELNLQEQEKPKGDVSSMEIVEGTIEDTMVGTTVVMSFVSGPAAWPLLSAFQDISVVKYIPMKNLGENAKKTINALSMANLIVPSFLSGGAKKGKTKTEKKGKDDVPSGNWEAGGQSDKTTDGKEENIQGQTNRNNATALNDTKEEKTTNSPNGEESQENSEGGSTENLNESSESTRIENNSAENAGNTSEDPRRNSRNTSSESTTGNSNSSQGGSVTEETTKAQSSSKSDQNSPNGEDQKSQIASNSSSSVPASKSAYSESSQSPSSDKTSSDSQNSEVKKNSESNLDLALEIPEIEASLNGFELEISIILLLVGLSVIFLVMILLVFRRRRPSDSKVERILQATECKLKYSLPISMAMALYNSVSIPTILRFFDIDNQVFSRFSGIFVGIGFLIYLGFPLFYMYKVLRFSKIQASENFNRKYSVLYSKMSTEKKSKVFFAAILFFKKTLVLLAVTQVANTENSLMFLVFLHIGLMLGAAIIRPFKDILDHWSFIITTGLTTVNFFLLFLIEYSLLFFFLGDYLFYVNCAMGITHGGFCVFKLLRDLKAKTWMKLRNEKN